MASTQVDIDTEMKSMVRRFRVAELQVLLRHAGRSKSGRKHELLNRALQLIESSGTSHTLQEKILDLHGQRCQLQSHPRNSQFSSTKREGVKDEGVRMGSSRRPSYHGLFRDSYPQPSIKFTDLPFYEYISEILPPMPMTPTSNRSMQDSTFKFRINSQQGLNIRSGTTINDCNQEKYSVQIQLRFCLLDTSCEQDDVLPPNLCVKINRCSVSLPPFIPPTKSGQEPKRVNQPLNITSYCRRLSAYEEYTLEVKWSPESPKTLSNDQSYGVAINLVRQLNVDDLMQKLHQAKVIPPSESRDVIREKLSIDPESDIATTSLKVSLLCPLGKMRMRLPARPLTCSHLQCFDATFFLMMNEKKPTWTCPVCDRPANFASLAIDGLFVEILSESKADEIEFTEDGSWHSAIKATKKTETLVLGTSSKPIDLSSSACKMNVPETKKSEPVIIDLTESGDEDEDLTRTPPPPRSPMRLSSGTPMSISSSPGMKLSKPDVNLANYASSCRKSPREKTYSPVRTPYYRSASPLSGIHQPNPSNHFSSLSPEPSSHNNSPLTYPPMASHFSRYSINGVDTPPNPSPHVSNSPANVSSALQHFGSFDMTADGYPFLGPLTDPQLSLGFPRTPFDLFHQRPLFNNLLAAQMSQFLHSPLGIPPHSMDPTNRESQLPGSSSNVRTSSGSQSTHPTDDRNYPIGAISID